jgi:hypothetical protein
LRDRFHPSRDGYDPLSVCFHLLRDGFYLSRDGEKSLKLFLLSLKRWFLSLEVLCGETRKERGASGLAVLKQKLDHKEEALGAVGACSSRFVGG